jgi:hypothetical protein
MLGKNDPNVRKYLNIQNRFVPRCMRNFMVEFYRQCTISTPVDTGRARWGWNCTIGTPSFTVPAEGKYNIDAGRAVKTFTVTAVSGKDTLYITNAVPYIGKLNEGWSRQAPARFVELAFDYAFNKLEKFISVRGYALDS